MACRRSRRHRGRPRLSGRSRRTGDGRPLPARRPAAGPDAGAPPADRAGGRPRRRSVGVYLLALQISVGHWDAYFLLQANYEHRLRTPLGTTYDALKSLFRPAPFAVRNFLSFNELLVTAALVCVIIDRIVRRRDRTVTDILLLLCLIGIWVIPVSTSHETYSRGEAALLPIAILIGKLKPPLAIGFALAAVLLAIPMEISFLHDFLN